MSPSDVYAQNLLYLFYTLVNLYYTTSVSDQASSLAPDWILLPQRPRIPASFTAQQQPFNCSHEIRRCFLLGRKAMTNIDSVFKSKHITLLTKFHSAKAMVFPVNIYGSEIWIMKKAEY